MQCDGSIGDCMPESVWAAEFMDLPETKAPLGVPAHLNFTFVNRQVHEEFVAEGDMCVCPRLPSGRADPPDDQGAAGVPAL